MQTIRPDHAVRQVTWFSPEAVHGTEPIRLHGRGRLGGVVPVRLVAIRVVPVQGDGSTGPYQPFSTRMMHEWALWALLLGGTSSVRAVLIDGFPGLWLLFMLPAPVEVTADELAAAATAAQSPPAARSRATRIPPQRLAGVPEAPAAITHKPKRTAWRLGWAASRDGLRETDCPYPTQPGYLAGYRSCWLDGFRAHLEGKR